MRETPPQVMEQIARDAEANQVNSVHVRRANAEAFPGPLAQAFAEDPPNLHGFKLRPVVAADFILLRKLGSPLYKQTQALTEHAGKIKSGLLPEGTPMPKTDFEDEEAFEMIYQFTIPIHQARSELNKGRDYFRECALRAVADKLNPMHVPDLVTGIVNNFLATFATVIEHAPPAKEGGTEIVNFPAPPAAKATASAGGLNTSPI